MHFRLLLFTFDTYLSYIGDHCVQIVSPFGIFLYVGQQVYDTYMFLEEGLVFYIGTMCFDTCIVRNDAGKVTSEPWRGT
jgi:hypothetical protein